MAVTSYESSRSAIVALEECNRLRLLEYDLDGTGYQPKSASVALLSGIHIHEGFAFLLDPEGKHDLEGAVEVMLKGYTEEFEKQGLRQAQGEDVERILIEQRFMLEMMLRGWHRIRMPQFLSEYEVMSVERAWRWELTPGILLPLRMDAIVRRRDDGLLHVVDFKGTGTGDENFVLQHERSRQTILYLTALEEHTGEAVGGMLYEGLVRGSFRQDTAKGSPYYGQRIQNSPLTYAYKLEQLDGMHLWRADYTKAAGWMRTGVWESFTPAEWLEFLVQTKDKEGRVLLEKMFVPSVAVNPDPGFRQSSRRQIAIQERAYLDGLLKFNTLRDIYDDTADETQAHLEAWATQKTGRCSKFGADHRCAFAAGGLCFLPNATEILKDEEGFMKRVPHHAPAQEAE